MSTDCTFAVVARPSPSHPQPTFSGDTPKQYVLSMPSILRPPDCVSVTTALIGSFQVMMPYFEFLRLGRKFGRSS